tara:strand:+ start:341 stop:523 length:183 start_codon:yes stop_codon:yes gene_type:complete
MRKDKNIINSDPNYPENFWPKLITLSSIGAFIFWVMTAPDAHTIVHKHLLNPILNKLNIH